MKTFTWRAHWFCWFSGWPYCSTGRSRWNRPSSGNGWNVQRVDRRPNTILRVDSKHPRNGMHWQLQWLSLSVTVHAKHGSLGNAGLGVSLAGHETIKDSIEDDVIRAEVTATMEESALFSLSVTAWSRSARGIHPKKFLVVLLTPFLRDEVDRVGRVNLLRKLSPQDRLVKPLNGTPSRTTKCSSSKRSQLRVPLQKWRWPQAVESPRQCSQKGFAETLALFWAE